MKKVNDLAQSMDWQRENRRIAAALHHPDLLGWTSAHDSARILLGLGNYSVMFARLGCSAVLRQVMTMICPSLFKPSPRWVKVAVLKSHVHGERATANHALHQRLSVGGYLLVGMLWLYLLAILVMVGWIILASPLLHVLPPLLQRAS